MTPMVRKLRAFLRHSLGVWLGLGYLAILVKSARVLGFSRDESFYFDAANRYASWFRLLASKPSAAMERRAIDAAWSANHEHPSLVKSAFALSHWLFYEKLQWFADESTAWRFPGMLCGAIAVGYVYYAGKRRAGPWAGAIAAVLLAAMPRVFYQAHLACFDIPVVMMWALCVGAYGRALRTGRWRDALLFGLTFGLAMDTKHNAWMLPAVIVPHLLIVGHARYWRARLGPLPTTLRERLRPFAFLKPVVAMAVLGPLVFLACWPWMWHDTHARWNEYTAFHLNHVYYNMEFLHVNYAGPPSPILYLPVMVLATVPTVTLLLAALGIGSTAKALVRAVRSVFGKTHRLHAAGERLGLDLLAMLVPLGPFFLPKTPIFGGTKHWMPAYPFIALFAARGIWFVGCGVGRWLRDRFAKIHVPREALLAALSASMVAAPIAETWHSHPFGLSAYVPLVGGSAGAATMGLNRQFWGFTTQSLDAWFRANTKPGDRIFIHDTTHGAWAQMVKEKRLPEGRQGVFSPSDSNVAIVHHELHMAEAEANIQTAYGVGGPAYVLTHDGVPIISVYKRPVK